MKFLTFLTLPLLAVFLTFSLMAKLVYPDSTGLTDTEIEEIWMSKNAIAVEQYYSPPKSTTLYCDRNVPPPPPPSSIFGANTYKPEIIMHSTVSTNDLLCGINKEFCKIGI